MSQKKGRRTWRIRGLMLAGILAVANAIAPLAAPSAQAAAVPCPTTNMTSPAITSWETEYADHGVTLCTGLLGAGNPVVKVQIIDLAGGASLDSLPDPRSTYSDPAYNTFDRHTIGEWADLNSVGPYGSANKFSVTNGAFFTSTTTATTRLSLPLKSGGVVSSHGYAIVPATPRDPAWETPKRVIYMDELVQNGQNARYSVRIASFPTYYTATDANCDTWDQCIVGFDPLQDPTGNNAATDRRTYVGTNAALGTNATRAFILTSPQGLTVAQATAVLKHFGSVSEIQFDGGGSTSMENASGGGVSSILNRAIPHVFEVWYAP